MQIRCYKCSMPIALSQEALYTAMDLITDENLTHYDVRCPRCRKTNRISADQIKKAATGWQREREAPTE